jgi:dihydrofolate synthase/folylpolyglutamate synthase
MFQRVGAAAYKADINNTIALCKILRNPEKKLKSVHIAGTNGKGSVSHFIASILQEQGYKVGLYTSPHLKDFRERIRINGRKIPKEKIIDFVKKYKKLFQKIQPSFFEYTFGMAINYFEAEQIDIAIMETGMGGRLDSTNVVNPIISVITNIGFDHTRFLGDTLKKIAGEKAGIIKPGIPVIIGETRKETKEVFVQKAKETKSEISFADRNYKVNIISTLMGSHPKIVLDIESKKLTLKKIICPLSGQYQAKNLLSVFQIIEKIEDMGFPVSEESIYNGIRNVITNTGIMGRWQILNREPLTICDTGHNVDGIREIVAQIEKTTHQKLHFVLGMVNDKNINSVIKLLPKEADYYFCKANIPRGLNQDELKSRCKDYKLKGDSYNSVIKAYKEATKNALKDDLVFVGGSTFVVAEIL